MKYFYLLACLLFAYGARADTLTLKDEAGQMGLLSGLAVACHENAKTLDNYELIASRIIANKALTEADENEAKKEFVWQKLKTMKKKDTLKQAECREILNHFRQMSVFQSIVYADGGIKMPDGSYLPPKRPFKAKK